LKKGLWSFLTGLLLGGGTPRSGATPKKTEVAVKDGYERAFKKVLGFEGDYTDDPDDSGGKTKFGITVGVARKCGYRGKMRDLPLSVAKQIYRKEYWEALGCHQIKDQLIAFELFDTGVNCGIRYAGRFLQRALNLFNNRGKRYPELKVDGRIGPTTIRVLHRALRVAPYYSSIIWKAQNCFQGTRYAVLCEKKQKNEKYSPGWFRARVGVKA
jgi:lysozyme family protein